VILDKSSKTTQRKKNILFNKWCWDNWIVTCRRMKLDPYLTPYIKVNSRWIKVLSLSIKTTKILEENIERNLYVLGFANGF
jgi:hypothetical protein